MAVFSHFSPPKQIVKLQNGSFRAEIWPELGGAVANFDYLPKGQGPLPILRPTVRQETYKATDLACWPLVPYSNRINRGNLHFKGKTYQLALNVAAHPHALHGYGWQRAWTVVEADQSECHLTLDHVGDQDWPFACKAEQIFKLNDDGLTITQKLLNSSSESMPYGLGQHPYVVRPRGTKLFADVDGVWLTDDTMMVTEHSELPPQWNLRDGCLLDDIFMDNCYDGFKGAARILWPDGSELDILGSAQLKFLVVYNPPQENYVCVEPVSHMTDAINRAARGEKDTGDTALDPGQEASATQRFIYRAKK